MDDTDQVLADLLKSPRDQLSEHQIQVVVQAFLPDRPSTSRSSAYLALSACCHPPNKDRETQSPSGHVIPTFYPTILSYLQDTKDEIILAALTFVTALFQVDPPSATAMFLRDEFVPSITEILDINASDLVSLHIAHMFAQAVGQKACRTVLAAEQKTWLKEQSKQASDTAIRTAAAVALVKLEQGTIVDDPLAFSAQIESNEIRLADLMKKVVLGDEEDVTVTNALEGLAYTSQNPIVKERLSSDPVFIHRLLELVPQSRAKSSRKDHGSTMIYGIVLIVLNLVAYRPQLSEEQAQVAKLKRMANAGAGTSGKMQDPGLNVLDDNEHVRRRGRQLTEAGVASALTSAIRGSESRGVKLGAAKALRHIIEDKDNRGKVLQSGGGKALMTVIRDLVTEPNIETSDLQPFQALAKLAITSSPLQVFGPDVGATHDAVRPLVLLLTHSSSTLLQRFEALMALTNISSLGPEAAQRIATSPDLMTKLETLLLDDNTMVQRAAVELLCNLIAGSDTVFGRYTEGSGAKSKLRIMAALTDVGDIPTRLAASGALATLTISLEACTSLIQLEAETHRILPVIKSLMEPLDEAADEVTEQAHSGLVHRGIACIRNLLVVTKGADVHREVVANLEGTGTVKSLMSVAREMQNGGNQGIFSLVTESLKCLVEGGVKIT